MVQKFLPTYDVALALSACISESIPVSFTKSMRERAKGDAAISTIVPVSLGLTKVSWLTESRLKTGRVELKLTEKRAQNDIVRTANVGRSGKGLSSE